MLTSAPTPQPVLLQVGGLPPADEAALAADFAVVRLFEAADRAACLATHGPKVRAIVTRGDLGADAALLAACPALEVVAVFGVGTDAVDLGVCTARGIRVTNTPDVLTGDVADLAVAMMLAQGRRIVAAEAWARSGDWAARGGFPLTRRVHGARAGILGLGRIGTAIARRCAGFDMPIAYTSRSPKDHATGWTHIADPVALARQSDVLFVALAATPETRHIVNRAVIEAVGPEGMIVNISRAANVDEDALIAALASGALGSAALDVFEGEPDLDPRFRDLPNILLQPHHGSGTAQTRAEMGRLVRDNLTAHFAGNPLLTPVV